MTLDREALCRLIPHGGAMCLLDEVVEWDGERILCRARNHGDPAHPLREGGRLPALCAIEYAAQAMAVHGGLLAGERGARPELGFLGSVREVNMFVDDLEDITAPLDVLAVRQMAGESHFLYQVEVSAAGRMIMTGRAAVFLQKDAGE